MGISTRLSALQPWNPLHHARLLWWVFLNPSRLDAYQRQFGKESTLLIGTWLAATLMWLPLAVLTLAVGVRAVPLARGIVPLWIIALALLVGWLVTVWLASLHDVDIGLGAGNFGPIFESEFTIVFGLSIGVAIALAFITGLDISEIVVVENVFGTRGILFMMGAYSIAFGATYAVAYRLTSSGMYIIAPVMAMIVTGLSAFGLGFTGVFVSIFLTVFLVAFAVAMAVVFLFLSFFIDRMARHQRSSIGAILRGIGFAALVAGNVALMWLCLLGGWRVLNM